VQSGTRGRGRGRAGGSFFKRNRPLILGGGALGAFLLMSHKGGQQGQGQSSQQPSALAAYQQGVQDASGLIGQSTGSASGGLGGSLTDPGFGSVVGGGATGDSTGALAGDPGSASDSGVTGPLATGSAPVGPINVTVNAPGGSKRKPKPTGAGKGKGKGSGKGHSKPTGNTTRQRGAPSQKGGAKGQKATTRPKQAAQGKPAPARNHSGGGHPNTQHKTATGKKKKSPADVESIMGFGAGIVVMGRQFPGAQSHRMGPPMRSSDGTICRRVMVDYGGRTEQHIVMGDGAQWIDNAPGVNPPSRGTPMLMSRSDPR
jgi:hypothetical protein